jgi:hypothetical protein
MSTTPVGIVVSQWESYTGKGWLPREVVGLLRAAGARHDQIVNLTAISIMEAGMEASNLPWFYCWDRAIFRNPGHDPVTSVDRGLFQFNDFYEPQITDAQAFDPATACRLATQMSTSGGYSLWSSWQNHLRPEAMSANKANNPTAYKAAVNAWERAIVAVANECAARKGIPLLPNAKPV